MTLTASNVTEEDKQTFAIPSRPWQILLQFKFQRMLMTIMRPGVNEVFEKFDQQEIQLMLNLIRERNRKQEKQ